MADHVALKKTIHLFQMIIVLTQKTAQFINLEWGNYQVKMPSKACRICSAIYETGDKCPKCGSKEFSDSFKGRIIVINPEKSEVSQKLKLKVKGNFAIKNR